MLWLVSNFIQQSLPSWVLLAQAWDTRGRCALEFLPVHQNKRFWTCTMNRGTSPVYVYCQSSPVDQYPGHLWHWTGLPRFATNLVLLQLNLLTSQTSQSHTLLRGPPEQKKPGSRVNNHFHWAQNVYCCHSELCSRIDRSFNGCRFLLSVVLSRVDRIGCP